VTVMRQRSTNYCQNDGWTYLFAIMRVPGDVEHYGSSHKVHQVILVALFLVKQKWLMHYEYLQQAGRDGLSNEVVVV
jgi:hypothetical protein